MSLKDQYLADDFALEEAQKLNSGFAHVKAPFYVVCGARAKKGKLQVSYRRYSDGCTGFVNARYISEKEVESFLRKNDMPPISILKKSNSNEQPDIKGICKINQPVSLSKFIQPAKPEQKKEITSKQIKAGLVLYGDDCEIVTQSEKIKGRYGIIELTDLIPSHSYSTFSKNQKYPEGCQERNYHSDKAAQAEVKRIGSELDPKFLLSDNPSPTDGAPIVNKDGIVLGGNGRTMSLLRAKEYNPGNFINYQTLLLKKSESFGFEKNDIWQFKEPVLVRVIHINMSECHTWSWKLNTDTKKEQTTEARAIAWSKDLNQKDIDDLALLLQNSEAVSFSDIKNDIKTVRELIRILRKAGIIVQTNQEQWLSGADEFSDNGLMYLETMLLAVVLKDKELLNHAKEYSAKIVKSLAYFLRLKKLSGKWNLLNYFIDAIKSEHLRMIKGLKKSDITRQFDISGKEFERNVEAAWNILDLKTDQFKKVMERVTNAAETESQAVSSSAMFGEKIEPYGVMVSYTKKASTLEDKKNKKQSIFRRSKF